MCKYNTPKVQKSCEFINYTCPGLGHVWRMRAKC